jgi:hypothetical protein
VTDVPRGILTEQHRRDGVATREIRTGGVHPPQRAQSHSDFPVFDALPGAGAVFAPRLLIAFGEQRDRYASADELQKYAGIAPMAERSGNTTWVHWRLQCLKFLRPTLVAWAAESTRHFFWARTYYQQQRDKGASHQAAVRALALI